jgi:hypothetical protein
MMYPDKAGPGDDCLEKTPNEYGYRRGIVAGYNKRGNTNNAATRNPGKNNE